MFVALVSPDSGDMISASLIRLGSNNPDISIIDVASLIKGARLMVTDDGCRRLSFDHMSRESFLNQKRVCINRAFINAKTLMYSEENSLLLQTELEVFLRDHINSFPRTTAKAGMYGLCGDYLPLYLQWQRVSKLLPECLIPKYAYAFGTIVPDVEDFKAPIYKSVFDFRTWKTNSPPPNPWHTFVVERPKGEPLVAVVVGHKIFFSYEKETKLMERLRTHSKLIAQAFGSEFGEILYFFDGDTICFAAFSHVVRFGIPQNHLDNAVAEVMVDVIESKRC